MFVQFGFCYEWQIMDKERDVDVDEKDGCSICFCCG